MNGINIAISLSLLATWLLANQINAEPRVSCRDENGDAVDWFIAYKFPLMHEHDDNGNYYPLNTGYAYSYLSSKSIEQSPLKQNLEKEEHTWPTFYEIFASITFNLPSLFGNVIPKFVALFGQTQYTEKQNDMWIISDKLITDEKSAIIQTLNIVYDQADEPLEHIFYNDGPPTKRWRDSKHGERAHAKGAIIMDGFTGEGLWLTHSTPQFPPPSIEPLKFHNNSRIYAQDFMCISFDLAQSGAQVIAHLSNMYPLIYDHSLSDSIYKQIPQLNCLPILQGRHRRYKTCERAKELKQVIKTMAGKEITLFSKSDKFDADLYSGWLSHQLNTTLFVQSWRRGSGDVLNSTCPRNDFHINNVEDMVVEIPENKLNATWSYMIDHSKWAISENEQSSMVCINDINRMKSQFSRGGGATCIKCHDCWKIFFNTIHDLEPCHNNL